MQGLLEETAARAARYSAAVRRMRVSPEPDDIARLEALGGRLPQNPSDPKETLVLLDDIGSPATVATTGRPHWIVFAWAVWLASLAARFLFAANHVTSADDAQMRLQGSPVGG